MLTLFLSYDNRDFGLSFMGNDYHMRLTRDIIDSIFVTKFSMNNNLMGCEFYEQFEGYTGDFVLPNDWLISIEGWDIQINGQDFDKLPLLDFIPFPIQMSREGFSNDWSGRIK